MLKYTICFIKQADQILLLNREKPSWMGMWNGVGGKLELNESPRESILREIEEETGVIGPTIHFRGLVTWSVDQARVGSMYTYVLELPSSYRYETPRNSEEGLLDWKNIDWILDPENRGIAYYIPKSLEKILFDSECYEYRCYYSEGHLVHYKSRIIDSNIEKITDNKLIEKLIFSNFTME